MLVRSLASLLLKAFADQRRAVFEHMSQRGTGTLHADPAGLIRGSAIGRQARTRRG